MMTPEPHYIPGYAGYVPQFKYKFGNTYGCQTNRIFMDPCVTMSPRAVLTDTCGDCCPVRLPKGSLSFFVNEGKDEAFVGQGP